MAPTWNREPIRFMLRQIEESAAYPLAVKSHVSLWASDLGPIPEDTARQSVLACAIWTYAQRTRLAVKAIRSTGESDVAERRDRRILQLDNQLQKLLRVSRIGVNKGNSFKKGIFTAPKPVKGRQDGDRDDDGTPIAQMSGTELDSDEASVR